jgi:hypothetical protein
MAVDAWDINCAAAVARELDERGSVELGRERRVYGNAPVGPQMEVTLDVSSNELARAKAPFRRNIPAASA